MKLFQIIQEKFAILGITQAQSIQKQPFNRRIVVAYFIYGSSWSSSVLFLFRKANTFEDYTNNIYITSATAMIIFCFSVVVFKMSRLFKFINDCGRIVDRGESEPEVFDAEISNKIYSKTDHLVEKLSEIGYLVMAKITPVIWIWPKVFISYFTYFVSDAGSDSFILPILMVFPFNWKNLTGYLVAATIQYVMILYLFIFVACMISLGVGAYFFAVSAAEDENNNLEAINKSAKNNENRLIVKQLGGYIQYHSNVKKLLHVFLEIYQPVFMIMCTWSLITICGVMLMIQMELRAHNLLLLLVTISYACYAFGVVLIICELGQRLSDAFDGLCDTIEAFDWYLYPHKIQRFLPNLLIAAQQKIELECFGSTTGTRETFKRVTKSGFSYFMMIRQFMK